MKCTIVLLLCSGRLLLLQLARMLDGECSTWYNLNWQQLFPRRRTVINTESLYTYRYNLQGIVQGTCFTWSYLAVDRPHPFFSFFLVRDTKELLGFLSGSTTNYTFERLGQARVSQQFLVLSISTIIRLSREHEFRYPQTDNFTKWRLPPFPGLVQVILII